MPMHIISIKLDKITKDIYDTLMSCIAVVSSINLTDFSTSLTNSNTSSVNYLTL